MRKLVEFALCFAQSFAEDELGIRAAALAYYAVFAIFPLLLLLASVAGFFMANEARQDQIMQAVIDFTSMIPGGSELIISTLDGVVSSRGSSGLLGVIGLLWAASGFFRALEVAVNFIFGVSEMRPMWKSRMVGIIMAVIVVPLLILAAGLSLLGSWLINALTLPDVIESVAFATNGLVSAWLVATLAFSLLYRFVPSQSPPLRYTIIGASLAALSWGIVTLGFNWYLSSGLASYNLIYGPISTVIVLMLWLYLSSLIIIIGAELTAHLAGMKPCQDQTLPPLAVKVIDRLP